MPVLYIDSATPNLVLALWNDQQVLRERRFQPQKQLGESLLSLIEAELSAQGLRVRDLREIVVGTGPGSLSSLRNGIATGMGLSSGLDVPLTALCTTDVIAESAQCPCAVLVDSFSGQCAFVLYDQDPSAGAVRITPVINCKNAEALSQLALTIKAVATKSAELGQHQARAFVLLGGILRDPKHHQNFGAHFGADQLFKLDAVSLSIGPNDCDTPHAESARQLWLAQKKGLREREPVQPRYPRSAV